MTTNVYLSRKQLAEKLFVSSRTILRLQSEGLPFIQVTDRKVVYDYEKVQAWLEERNK